MPIPPPDRWTMTLGDAMYTMRAIRRFRPDPLEESDLRDILDAARQAPNGGNAQPWRFLLVTDAEKRARLGELYHEAWWAKRKDEGISGPEDIPPGKGVRQSAMRFAGEIGNTPAFVLVCATARGAGAAQSVIPSVQNLLLAARSIGIGGTITTLHAVVEERVHELFGIPRRGAGGLLRAPRLPARALRPPQPQAARGGRRPRLLGQHPGLARDLSRQSVNASSRTWPLSRFT